MKKLDDKGRCCGRKPIVYKREGHKFCSRCCGAYDINTGDQIPNWAWEFVEGKLIRVDSFGNTKQLRNER